MDSPIFDSRSAFLSALDILLDSARQSLCIFDRHLQALDLDQAQRFARLTQFLQGHPQAQVRIVVHDSARIRLENPRLLALLTTQGHRIAIHETEGEARAAEDALILADDQQMLRRFQSTLLRGRYTWNDAEACQPYIERFEALWASSHVAISATTLGL